MLGLRSVASTARRLLPNIMFGASSSSSSNLFGATRGFRATAKMGRAPKQRVHMLRNMVTSLIEHERIKTGHVKAKQVARLAEKLVTAAKRGTLDSHRWAAKWVMTKDQLAKLGTNLQEVTAPSEEHVQNAVLQVTPNDPTLESIQVVVAEEEGNITMAVAAVKVKKVTPSPDPS